jgi:hypothetical protein
MTDVPRITITPRTVDAQEVASIVSLVQLGRVPEAWERFQVASVGDGALARLGGVINAALAVPPPDLQWLAIPWGDGKRYEVPDLAEQTVVVPLDVPADAGPSVAVGRASAYEYGGSLGMLRVVSISEQPGDTSEGTALLVSGGMTVASINFSTQAAAGAVRVQPGRRYYFNLRNLNPEPGVVYPAAVEINWPR